MRRRTGVILGLIALLPGLGIGISALGRARRDAAREYSRNNLRELNHYATGYESPNPTLKLKPAERAAVPPGTVVRLEYAPAERLSWVADALPYFNQKRQPLEE